MIRKFKESDIKSVMQIWLSGNEDAHSFIPGDYWRSNFSMVREQLLKAEVYVYETDVKIQGFIGIKDEYIAGIFADKNYRSCGIGKQLLDYTKQIHNKLSLDVYQKNKQAVAFYSGQGFSVLSKGLDEATGESEYTMVWVKAESD